MKLEIKGGNKGHTKPVSPITGTALYPFVDY